MQVVVGEVVETLRPEAQRQGVELAVEQLPPTIVACSAGVLASITGNLLENAVQYMGARIVKRVTVRATRDGSSTRVEVRDTGPGIPRRHWQTFFDPHLRPAGETPPGLGLGLATVRRLALAHGGRVGIAANEPAGTVVWFELPNVVPATAAASGLGWRTLVRRHRHA